MKALIFLCALPFLIMTFGACSKDSDFTLEEDNITGLVDPKSENELEPISKNPVPVTDRDNLIIFKRVDTNLATAYSCVPNIVVSNGHTMLDYIERAKATAVSYDDFIAKVDKLTSLWVSAGLITRTQKSNIMSCVSRDRF